MKKLKATIFTLALLSPLASHAEITCHVEGGKAAGLDQQTIQKLHYDVFKAVKRLGWTVAKDLKSCDIANMKYPKVPMVTTEDEIIVFNTAKAVIQYAENAYTREYLCHDMKLNKSYRKSDGNDCPQFLFLQEAIHKALK